jgi:cobalt-zinc-cadmium efflux system membrane fusion protein
MNMKLLIIGSLLLAGAGFGQELACDCADCRAKAVAAEGNAFTLPGLEGLNPPAACVEEHDHGQTGVSAPHQEQENNVEQTLLSAHSEHEGCAHDHGGVAEGIELPGEILAKMGIEVQKAESGTVARTSVFPAEIKLNRDRAATVSPRYPSIVRQVFVEIGDPVRKGDLLASLENRQTMAVYSVSAPFDGVIISKDLAVGETAGEDEVLYQVADLSSVWADISIFPKHQHFIRKGMAVELIAHDGHTASGVIKYISPIMSHETRTFTARCVLEGAGEDFSPGAFVRARIVIEQADVNVVVPREAVQVIDGESVVFTPGDHGFVATPVQTGLADAFGIEIRSGLKPTDRYVATGAFALKAQMVTSGMDPHAGHGH